MTEKATQIPFMGNIYSGSESTIAWLGESDVGSLTQTQRHELGDGGIESVLLAQPIMAWESENVQAYCDSFEAAPYASPDWPISGALVIALVFVNCTHLDESPFYNANSRFFHGDLDLISTCERALLAIFGASYWTRIWILQETTLAPVIKVQVGRHIIPLELFELLIDKLTMHL